MAQRKLDNQVSSFSVRKALTCRAVFTSCFKEIGIGSSLGQNTELDGSFFSVGQNIYSFIATSNGERTSFYAYAMTAITHRGAVRKLEQLFALGSTHNLWSCQSRQLKLLCSFPLL